MWKNKWRMKNPIEFTHFISSQLIFLSHRPDIFRWAIAMAFKWKRNMTDSCPKRHGLCCVFFFLLSRYNQLLGTNFIFYYPYHVPNRLHWFGVRICLSEFICDVGICLSKNFLLQLSQTELPKCVLNSRLEANTLTHKQTPRC